jgi:ribonuclease VapC
MRRRHLLDASALLALLLNEPGADQVESVLDDSEIHSVNLAEVVRKLVLKGIEPAEAASLLGDIDLDVIEAFSTEQAGTAGNVLAVNKSIGLSLGDAVCLVMAFSCGTRAVTAERSWPKTIWPKDLQTNGPEILLIR